MPPKYVEQLAIVATHEDPDLVYPGEQILHAVPVDPVGQVLPKTRIVATRTRRPADFCFIDIN